MATRSGDERAGKLKSGEWKRKRPEEAVEVEVEWKPLRYI
jgi:hypothetical protein